MLRLAITKKFKRDLAKITGGGNKNIEKLKTVVNILLTEKTLPICYRDHALKGRFLGLRECHIEPDWLLMYKIEKDILLLTLVRTGTHSELLDK